MRKFNDGDTITIAFSGTGFPSGKDLVVDRSAFDRINQAGGLSPFVPVALRMAMHCRS